MYTTDLLDLVSPSSLLGSLHICCLAIDSSVQERLNRHFGTVALSSIGAVVESVATETSLQLKVVAHVHYRYNKAGGAVPIFEVSG